jgi:putative restriction endonuclease
MRTGTTWLDFTQSTIEGYCNERGLRTFTLDDFVKAKLSDFEAIWPENKHAREKVRQQLQVLRDRGMVTFVDGKGTYTLRNVAILAGEVEEDKADFLRSMTPEKREYLIEVFARSRGWVTLARRCHGDYCLYPECANTFITPAGLPYVEVHHLVPLFEGGEDAVWNLSVLCAHHHRMAHFAEDRVKHEVNFLVAEAVRERCRSLELPEPTLFTVQ